MAGPGLEYPLPHQAGDHQVGRGLQGLADETAAPGQAGARVWNPDGAVVWVLVLEVEPRALHLLSRYFIIEIYPSLRLSSLDLKDLVFSRS